MWLFHRSKLHARSTRPPFHLLPLIALQGDPPSPPPSSPRRLDKIYINGHSGEIKIGDLGLAVLAPRRFAPGALLRRACGLARSCGRALALPRRQRAAQQGGPAQRHSRRPLARCRLSVCAAPPNHPPPAGVMPEGDPSNQYTRSVDIFAYGLLMLELVTGRKVSGPRGRGAGLRGGAASGAACLQPAQQGSACASSWRQPLG